MNISDVCFTVLALFRNRCAVGDPSDVFTLKAMVVCSYATSLYFLSLRSLCAFLNSGKCGTVYLGIRKDGVVCGVNVGRKEVHLVNIYDKNILGH